MMQPKYVPELQILLFPQECADAAIEVVLLRFTHSLSFLATLISQINCLHLVAATILCSLLACATVKACMS